MLYALTRPLPQPQRNEIANRIEQAYQQGNPGDLRHDPELVYACDAEPSHDYCCVYCAKGNRATLRKRLPAALFQTSRKLLYRKSRSQRHRHQNQRLGTLFELILLTFIPPTDYSHIF